jgi:hypothetical protein
MEELTGTSLPVFVGVTLVLFGGAAFTTGHATADTWRPGWHTFMYGVFLGVADRLFGFLLFGSELLSVTGYLLDTAILIGVALFAYRVTRARKMTSQYPWLYERVGLFGWRDRAP